MYEILNDLSRRPEPYSRYTAKDLWTRPHLASQMLQYHLSQETELASRPIEAIERTVRWIDGQLGLTGKRLCDLGCGPGLYASRFADRGAEVTGIDFSSHSVEYASSQAGPPVRYIQADYLADSLPAGFDIVTLIYCDLCVLSPAQRHALLRRIRKMLNPGGHLVMDVAGMGSLSGKKETTILENRLMGGFWAPTDYVGIMKSFVYPEEALILDRYLIIEPGETWHIFNWFQHFTPENIEAELAEAGLDIAVMCGGLGGEALEPDGEFIGIIARKA